jgi:hypothetical protein
MLFADVIHNCLVLAQSMHILVTRKIYKRKYTNIFVSNEATAQIVTRVRVFNADCWLGVSLHPEGPATGQLDQGFPWFSSLLSWYPYSRLPLLASHAALTMVTSQFHSNTALPTSYKN